jgi:Tol biopolymer transport system component
VIISPDGTRLVYVSERRLYARELDQPNAIELAGTEGAEAPFFSPDGKWVAFFAQGKLKKTLVSGGAPITLCDAPTSRGGSWGEDGNIIAALNSTTGLSRIPSAGGAPTPVTELANGEVTHRWPQILPGGKALLFAAHHSVAGWDAANIEVMSLVDRSRRTLQRGGTYGRYVPSGHLIYVNRGTLFAVPFDLDTLAVRGTPVRVLEQVAYSTYGAAQIDFSGNGTLVYQSRVAGATGHFIVQWLDGTNKTRPLLMKPGDYFYPKLSPDGQRLAMAVGAESGGQDIWIYELQGERITRLTFSLGANIYPLWSTDGRDILSGGDGILWTRANGAGKPEPLTQSHGGRQYPLSFTPDGKLLAFSEVNPGTGYDLFTVPLEDDGSRLRAGKPEVFLQTPFNEIDASFSPDGRWMAYSSDDSGSYQVYVRAFPDRGGKTQISNAGGLRPVWSRTARELFFESLDNRIMMATYAVRGDSFVAEKPRLWSEQKLMSIVFDNYDVAPDGKRIAAIVPTDAPDVQAQSHVIFLENFFDELRRRVPVGSK